MYPKRHMQAFFGYVTTSVTKPGFLRLWKPNFIGNHSINSFIIN